VGIMQEYLSVGIVLKPQGIKGEIKVKPLTDDEKRYDRLQTIYIKDEVYKELHIVSRRYEKGFVFLKLRGFETIESVLPLRNKYLWIPRHMACELPEDTYFIADLLGCRVETLTGEVLGNITHVQETGSNDVYIVRGGSLGEVLIPALKKVVTTVDIPNKLVRVDLTDMEGLLPDEN
jgi:16S rRNA processing protein RimM